MKFIIDAQLPPALARTLRALGCEAFAVRELGLREATDAQLWNYALQHGAAIVTKDEACGCPRNRAENRGRVTTFVTIKRL